MFTQVAPLIPLLLVIAAVIAVALFALRVKRDGWYATFLESADQRWRRHERERMDQWADRDKQRQRFTAAMVNKANDAADCRYAARGNRDDDGRPRPPAPARRSPARAKAAQTPTRPNADNIPSDTSSPLMTRADWVAYLTTE